MQRYLEGSNIITGSDGKRKYSTIYYPYFKPRDTDIYLYARRNERLDILAFSYYGDVTLWPILAVANNVGKGSLLVRPGKRLRIPYPVTQADVVEALLDINEKAE